MKYYSTQNQNNKVSFKDAILKGLADDKGLFMPEEIIPLSSQMISNIKNLSFQEIAFEISIKFVGNEISDNDLIKIIEQSITFEAPLVEVDKDFYVLELFHGPTLAFKDFGARFMARTMEHFLKYFNKGITILVATSGDTGSAVANGFLNINGIDVIVLFPSGKISKIQEKQITTLNNNVTAIEVNGTFDDCQTLVKTAFTDKDLKQKLNLSSANSINIGRLIPQIFYYFESYKQLPSLQKSVLYSIPSGNLGNLTAALFAKEMGLPITKIIAANNKNDTFTKYLRTGIFTSKPSIETISNAMDVGNPSNLTRIIELYKNDYALISSLIYSASFSDEETLNKMQEFYNEYNYIIDPHGAVGSLALENYQKEIKNDYNNIVLETAHPAKFLNVFETKLNFKPEMPERLNKCLDKLGNTVKISNSYDEFKEFLLS